MSAGVWIPVGVLAVLFVCLLLGVGMAIDAGYKSGVDHERARQQRIFEERTRLERAETVRIIAERKKWAEEKNNWPDFP